MYKRILVLIGTVTLGLTILLCILWLLTASAQVARAGPPPPGCHVIDRDFDVSTTLTGTCYHFVTDTVDILPSVVVTVVPPAGGTVLYFNSNTRVQVDGIFRALGQPDRPITFTSALASPARGAWRGIIFVDNSDPLNDVIQYSTIEYARAALQSGDKDYILILSNTFRYNGDGGNLTGAIVGDTDNSIIRNNVIYSNSNGIVLNESFGNQIVGNIVHTIDHYGVRFVQGVTEGGSNNTLQENEIYRTGLAGGGDGLRLENGSSNSLVSNWIYSNSGSAIYLAGQSSASVHYNYVYSNGLTGYPAAIYIASTPDMATNSVLSNTVYDEHADAIEYTASNGDTAPRMRGNALCSVPTTTFELENGSSVTISAPSNWWGTNTPTAGKEYAGPVNVIPRITLSLITSTADLPADGVFTSVITIALREPSSGATVPLASTRQTDPPAPNPRRIDLTTTMGVISPAVVFVGDDGFARATLTSAPTTGTATISAMAFCSYSASVSVRFAATNLAITKAAVVTQVVPGDALAYRITYSNTTGITASDVRILDTFPVGTIWLSDTAPALGWTRVQTSPQVVYTRTSLLPNLPESFVLTATVASATCSQLLTNTVTIGTRTVEETLADNTASAGPIPVICADVAITKTTAVTQTVSGGLITYTITYGNQGSASAENTLITDTLPPGTRYVTSSLPCQTCTPAGPLDWRVGTLPPGSSYSFSLTLQVDLITSTCTIDVAPNTVIITTTTPETTVVNNSAGSPRVKGVCPVDLVVVKDDDVGPSTPLSAWLTPNGQAAVAQLQSEARLLGPHAVTQHRDFVYEGDLVTYTIAVVNVGTIAGTNIVLTETLPQYTSYVTGSGWTAVTTNTYILPTGSLPPGDGRIYYFVVRVNDPITASVSSVVNHVCGFAAESDRNPLDNCSYEDTPVRRQPLRITKWAECVIPGKDFNYWILYTNTLSGTGLFNVPLTDTLPVSATFVGGHEWTCVGRECTQNIPIVPQGPSLRTLPVRLNWSYPYPVVTNTVVISDGRPFVSVIPIDTRPDLAVVKNDNIGPMPLAQRQAWEEVERQLYGGARLNRAEGNREFVRPGERITYTILYVNNGLATARNVVLTETLPAQTHYVGGGWTFAGDGLYTLPIGDLEPRHGGQLEFVVQVNDPFFCGADRIVNRVDIGGAQSECDLGNNWSADHTPITGCTPIKIFLPIVLKDYPPIPVGIHFSSDQYRVWESARVATITVMLNQASAQTVTVDYATHDGTAIGGLDYVPVSGTLTFSPGETVKPFVVQVLTDTIYETSETVNLELSRPFNGDLVDPSRAVLTIIDACPPTPPNCAPAVWCVFPSEFTPMGMAYDTSSSRLFVANQGRISGEGNLTIHAVTGEPLAVLDGLASAEGVALDKTRGRNRVYVAGGNSLYIVNVSGTPPEVLATVDVGIGQDVGAHAVAYNPNTDLVYVTGYRDDTVTVVEAETWHVVRRMTGFFQPSYIAVNTTTNKVYVSNHTGGVPWGYVSVISGTSIAAPNVYLSGDLYGLAVDTVHNRVYVSSISAARVYVIDGKTDTTMGDIQIIRASNSRPVPLRMTQVNPNLASGTHLWLTSSSGDLFGMDRLIVLSLPESAWPPVTPYVLRSAPVASSPEGGLAFDPNPASWRVFASSPASNLVTVSQDNATLCTNPLAALGVGEDIYRAVTHDYTLNKRSNR